MEPVLARSSSFLCVCSTTTIAASTSSPIAMAMPPSDMMLAVMPMARNGMNAMSTATGIVMIGMIALGMWSRNRRMMKTTVAMTSKSVSVTLPTALLMSSERS